MGYAARRRRGRRRAKVRGCEASRGETRFSYLPASKVAELSREERLQRVEKIPLQNDRPNCIETQALLSVVTEPDVTIEKALEVFWLHEADKELGKYAFIALHRLQFSVRTMCRLLRVHPTGFYTWLKDPLGRRANEDRRQSDLLLKAWEESGKVYGYPLAGR